MAMPITPKFTIQMESGFWGGKDEEGISPTESGLGGLRIVSAPSSVESSVASPSAFSHQHHITSPPSLHQLNQLNPSHSFFLTAPSPAPPTSHKTSKKRRQYSSYTGVTYNKTHKKYQACLTHNRKQHYLGRFATECEAAWAYDLEARRMKGADWKGLNFFSKADYKTNLSSELQSNRGPPTLKGPPSPIRRVGPNSTSTSSRRPPSSKNRTTHPTQIRRRTSRQRSNEIDIADILLAFSKSP